jgi:hypothetical protein
MYAVLSTDIKVVMESTTGSSGIKVKMNDDSSSLYLSMWKEGTIQFKFTS